MEKKVSALLLGRYGWLWLLLLLILLNVLMYRLPARLDLTREKRYTLSRATRDIVKKLDDKLKIQVFLKGDFPSGFRKLANSTNDFLLMLKEQNSARIQYEFIRPTEKFPELNLTYADTLIKLGALPINLTFQKKESQASNIIFPVARMTYNNRQLLVPLYTGARSRISQEEINSAEALLEYQFVKAIDKLTDTTKPGIAYSVGNGEPTDGRTYDLRFLLQENYQFGIIDLNQVRYIPDAVDLLMIVKPSLSFTEEEKLKIDQFVMRGGKLLCFIDNLYAERDSLQFKPETIAYDRNLNLTDLFFRYGIRINTDLVMDLNCDVIPLVVGGNSQSPQIEFLRWNYYPFLLPSSSGLTKGLGYVAAKFANSMDSIAVNDIKKTPLLVTSAHSRTIGTPALISLNENKDEPEHALFKKNAIPVAFLLEGRFTSFYKNRIGKAQADTLKAMGQEFKEFSVPNKMIIVADGDMVLNDFVIPKEPGASPEPLPMGWNRYTYTQYIEQAQGGQWFVPVSNREFLQNCVEYLVSNPAISETRNKDIVLRLLDSRKTDQQKLKWQLINIAVPVFVIIFFGWIYQQFRRRKYTGSF
ncbi:MAG: gliding motility-associated ABC transporter substrate-binding protein GldG [Chitinophagaceae bacterium]|nr:gliding motility-associated ABC transporter substrate-binding protein GldG [Chitinophagaceae bacterium]